MAVELIRGVLRLLAIAIGIAALLWALAAIGPAIERTPQTPARRRALHNNFGDDNNHE